MIARFARVVWVVPVGNRGDVQIGDDHDVEIFFFQVGEQLLEMRKAIRVHRKRTVLLLKIDVEIEYIRGNLVRPQTRRNFAQSRLRFVSETRLLETERPKGRQRRQPG